MLQSLISQLISLRGRIARAAFWRSLILVAAVFVTAMIGLEAAFGRSGSLPLYPPFFWALLALVVKRLHDRNQSSLRLLLLLIPLFGPLWIFLSLGVRKGSPGPNRYGADPLASNADYLAVK
jgi:uncharacterized membrane protein YhaH (DUF805 family)